MFILLTFLININIEAISQSLVDPILESSHTGICIYSLKKDRLVFEHNGAKLFVPASNQKILTTAAALHYLGGEFRYITRLKMRGEIQASSLLGDLILVGSGDPSIKDYSFLERWADIVKNLGVHTIIGSIIVDDRVFSNERLPEGWAWHYLDARYGAEISGFSFNGNVVKVTVKPGNKINDTAQVILDPQTQYVKIKNNLITVESLNGNTISQEINIYREPEANIIHLEGAVAKNFKGRTYEIAVKDPALFAGYYFKELLERRGIRVYGYPKRVDTLTANFGHAERQLDSIISCSMKEIVKETNKESKNLFAENLLKSIGYYREGNGSYKNSNSLIRKFLVEVGGDTSGVYPVDGSGLSRHNLLSPYNLVVVLRYMYLSAHRDDFYESLARPNEGTLFGRLLRLRNSLHAKTGTLKWISCISGYIENSTDNDTYAFSIMVNNFTGTVRDINRWQERIIEAMQE